MTDPFAPQPAAPQGAPSGATVPCAKCGTPVDPSQASWSEAGERICRRCEAVETIDAGDQRAAVSIMGGGLASFSIGVLSLCINPLLICSVGAFLSGLGTIIMLSRHPEYKARMQWRYPVTMITAVLGMLLSLVIPFFLLLGLAGAGLGAALR
ncbi:MAG TPA: hypothetical protein RMH99_06110 [Sandaracinaceae bacterium LLY-WYZ-13_1]|nr:hypothetical protein [Sandaracinaceae bacterium LLY-WYZ-13_1]